MLVASAAAVAAAEESSSTTKLDEKSLTMAKRFIQKIKGQENAPQSWNAMAKVMEQSFLGMDAQLQHDNENNNDNTLLQSYYQSSATAAREDTARKRALHWLVHEDSSSIDFSEEDDDLGLLHRYVVATIYFATEGDTWTRCSANKASSCDSEDERYLSASSHIKWDGIHGARNGEITWLDVSDRGLHSAAPESSFLPLELTLLSPTLELLWVSENPHLGGRLPDYLSEFQKLQSLSVYKTSVHGPLPEAIYDLKKLTSLRLYKSKFTGTISSRIEQLRDLKWFWIHENNFSGNVPSEMGSLKKLEGVTLHGNQFDFIITEDGESLYNNILPEALCDLRDRHLKHLWTDCEIGSVVPAAIVASGEEGGEKEKGNAGYDVKEGMRACSCCTRCFPRTNEVVAAVN